MSSNVLKLLEYKNKYQNIFKDHIFPDIIFCYKKSGTFYKFSDDIRYICIDPNFLISEKESFTIGHELGHNYLVDEKISFDGAKNIWSYLLIIYIVVLTACILDTWNVKEGLVQYFITGTLLFSILFLSFLLIGWKYRSKNYQVELFCDDFSFWINRDNVIMDGFGYYPLISSWTNPNGLYRMKRNRKIHNFEDITVESDINNISNLLCADLPPKIISNFNNIMNFLKDKKQI